MTPSNGEVEVPRGGPSDAQLVPPFGGGGVRIVAAANHAKQAGAIVRPRAVERLDNVVFRPSTEEIGRKAAIVTHAPIRKVSRVVRLEVHSAGLQEPRVNIQVADEPCSVSRAEQN